MEPANHKEHEEVQCNVGNRPTYFLLIKCISLCSRLRVAAKAKIINQSSPELVRCHAELWRNDFQKISTPTLSSTFTFCCSSLFREKQKITRQSHAEIIFTRATILENQEM